MKNNLKIWKSEKVSNILKKSQNQKSKYFPPEIEVSTFFFFFSFFIERNIFSRFRGHFIWIISSCLKVTFVILTPSTHFTPNDLQITLKRPQMKFLAYFKKSLEIVFIIFGIFFQIVWIFFQLFWYFDFDFGSWFSDLGSHILDLLSDSQISLSFEVFNIFLSYLNERIHNTFLQICLNVCIFFQILFADILYFYVILWRTTYILRRTDTQTAKKGIMNPH